MPDASQELPAFDDHCGVLRARGSPRAVAFCMNSHIMGISCFEFGGSYVISAVEIKEGVRGELRPLDE